MNDSLAKAYYEQLQEIDHKIKQLYEQMEQADLKMAELDGLVQNIDDFTNVDIDSEILVPIGAGIFAKAKLSDNKTLRINVGSDIVVNKTTVQAKNMLETQKREVAKYRELISTNIQMLDEQSHAIENQIKEKFKVE